MVDIHANLLRVMNDSDFLVILPDDVKYPLYACNASELWKGKIQPKIPGYLEIARYYFRYWTKERLFPDPEYSVMIFRGTVDAVCNTQKSSERAVWLVNDTAVKLLEDRYGTIDSLFHNENIYDLRKHEKNLLGFAEDNNIGFEFENGHYVARHINPFDAGSLYPKVDAFILAGGRNCGKTELTRQLLESANLRVEPFPPYKYDSAAYQNIVASREAMKRAEKGDAHAADALTGSFWDHVDNKQKELACEYIINDMTSTKELFEIYKKEEENENMKNNIINATIDEININTEIGYSRSEVEMTLHLYHPDAQRLRMAANDAYNPHTGHIPTISINLDDNCGGVVNMFPVEVKAEKVIFNNPATIVLWNDGTKTIVKKQKGDRYNKEEGLALCYMKKALGNSSRTFNDALHAGLEMEEK